MTELQGLRTTLKEGVAQSAAITIANIQTTDTILGVYQFPILRATQAAVSIVNRTAKTYISAASAIKVTSAATTGSMLLVFWFDASAGTSMLG